MKKKLFGLDFEPFPREPDSNPLIEEQLENLEEALDEDIPDEVLMDIVNDNVEYDY